MDHSEGFTRTFLNHSAKQPERYAISGLCTAIERYAVPLWLFWSVRSSVIHGIVCIQYSCQFLWVFFIYDMSGLRDDPQCCSLDVFRQHMCGPPIRMILLSADDQCRAADHVQLITKIQLFHRAPQDKCISLMEGHSLKCRSWQQAKQDRLNAKQQLRHFMRRSDEDQRPHSIRMVDRVIQSQNAAQ